MAIAPTKLNDRFEWFLEKATEIGIDEITPILCDHSERKVVKMERLEKIIQNIKICRKVNCKIKIANLAKDKKNIVDEKGRISFGISLGMDSVQSSEAIKF